MRAADLYASLALFGNVVDQPFDASLVLFGNVRRSIDIQLGSRHDASINRRFLTDFRQSTIKQPGTFLANVEPIRNSKRFWNTSAFCAQG